MTPVSWQSLCAKLCCQCSRSRCIPPPVTVVPLLDPADRVAFIVKGLRGVLAELGVRRLLDGAIVLLIWNRLGRIAQEFAVVAERVRAGTLPAGRRAAVASAPASPRPPRPPSPDGMPAGFAWLIRLGGWQAAGFGSQLQHLLSNPEMVALISAAPRQMGRVLRPLCWMLGIKPPPGLFPKRARKPRAPLSSGTSGATEAETPPAPKPRRRRPLRDGEMMTAAFVRSLSVPWRD